MDDEFTPQVNLDDEKRIAIEIAEAWGLELDPPFKYSNVSYVAPTGTNAVLKVPWAGDDESLHEADALELWNGDGAVRLFRRSGRVLLEERAVPGDDLSQVPDDEGTRIAIALALRLWRPATSPFRPVTPEVARWLDQAEGERSELVPLARELFGEVADRADWLVHGDFHHQNCKHASKQSFARGETKLHGVTEGHAYLLAAHDQTLIRPVQFLGSRSSGLGFGVRPGTSGTRARPGPPTRARRIDAFFLDAS